ncbi:MAG: DUF4011 domain-containing protein [Cyanobacteria bacterium]|nr:DUF4011 domain-containing protein [Cyanobacteriota bacterium]MDA1020654.1 DUF4011 domain-containing protein [Cyanobacteriota bacterium]
MAINHSSLEFKQSKIKSQLENWKKHLIDFSKRNQLLFFKPRPSMTIEFTEDPKDVFKKLVLESKSLALQHSITAFNTNELGTDGATEIPMNDDSLEPGMSFEDIESFDAPMAIDIDFDLSSALQTNKDLKSLDQCLSKLKTRAKASIQETGVNILYLTLFFLEWKPKTANNIEDIAKSPLLLLPVNLDRRGLNGAFKLNLVEDEIRINPTLAYKLDRDYGIDLSGFEEELQEIENIEQLEETIARIQAYITKDHINWIMIDESCLSLFSFAKLSLYKDIEENEKRIENHPIIRQISGELIGADELSKIQPLKQEFLVKADQIDSKLDANHSMQILDADSSQEEAINAAKAGQSFVIQGPPGTGKSQTIANIIAESLAQNKKILFVSEKKSALEVVVNRLKESKLDLFCLELHNSQKKKSEIIHKLKTSVDEIKALAMDSQRPVFIDDINKVKKQIQSGIDELHKIREPISKSLYEIYGELSDLEMKLAGAEGIEFTVPSIEKIDLRKLSQLDYWFKDLACKQEILNDYGNFIWRNADVQNLSFELENEIKTNFIEFKNILKRLEDYANPIAQKYFAREVTNIKEFKWLAEASKLAIDSPFPKKDWFNPTKLNDVQTLTIEAKIEHEEYTMDKTKLLGKYNPDFLELNHEELITKFTKKFTGIFRFLNFDYYQTVDKIKKMSVYNEAKSIDSIIRDLEHAAQLDKKANEIAKEETELKFALGDFYDEFDTDWNETITAINWVRKVMGKFGDGSLPNTLLEVVSENTEEDSFSDFQQQAKDLIQAYELLKFHSQYYKTIFPNPNLDFDKLSFSELSDHLEDLITNITKIEDWIEFKRLETEAKNLGMGQFVTALIHSPIKNIDAGMIKSLFLRKLYQLWADKIEIENPQMRKFSGDAQQLLIDKFTNLDLQLQAKNQYQVSKSLSLNWIEFASNILNKQDLQVLSHELNKKKKHKPARLLIQEIPELLQTLKPCWMMSPLSVSQLIEVKKNNNDHRLVEFDLVIFDEASQIRTEDAICSIYRGKQLILAGDSNQLPPTNFFSQIDNDDDDYENNNFESVLDECSVFLDSHTLNWHYRSRHEDLIKFSNYHIYDNQLITFPSPIAKSDDYGIEFELIDKGYYEKGSRFNRKEAARVAEAIIEHYAKNPETSLGVIAFSEAQQFAIERELAKELRKNPEQNQSFLDEERTDSLFIKNLENVQGDERDVIYFSIGYARDRKGNLSHNFGPLNRDGGHRRLNVAITRARNKLKVFSSITSSDIDLSRTSAQGATLLKKYLGFTEEAYMSSRTGETSLITANELSLPASGEAIQSSNSDGICSIEESIARSIEARGYQVERFLGSSDYRIDIAIRDPQNPDQFILAIETDGKIYQSAKTTRDRERLRRQVLKSLNWNVHKIWARDWVRNAEQELAKLITKID